MTVHGFMAKSGISPKLKGFELTRRAIEICIEEPDIKLGFVYFAIAKEYDQKYKPVAVERNIRTAISDGFEKMDQVMKEEIFSGFEKKPTTAAFLKTVAYAIRRSQL